MSHNLDVNSGQASFASARKDAWHQLGVTVPHSMTAAQAMEYSNLSGWNLRQVELLASDEETGEMVPFPERFAVVRDNPVTAGQVDPLGVVGPAYTLMPNESLVELLDNLVDESGAHYETAGAIDGGRKVFVTMKLPNHISVGGVDQVDTYLAAMTSHDGSMSTRLMVTPVRIVCQNTLNVALRGSKAVYSVRHTSGVSSVLLGEAREALQFTFDYLEDFQDLAEKLINTEMTSRSFQSMAQRVFSPPEGTGVRAETIAENKIQLMSELFTSARTQENIRGTAWAGFNAITEYYDHFSDVRVPRDQVPDAQARRAILDPTRKRKALSAVLQEVGL